MRPISPCLLGFLMTAVPGLEGVAQSPPPIAFVDVSLVPLDSARVLEHRTVLVRDGRVAAIGPAQGVRLDSGTVTIDGRGKYLMPGLVDMHVHLFDSRDLLLYLANGITTIRNLGDYAAADSILRIRGEIASGKRPGPTIYTSGNWLDGDPPFRNINTIVRTPAEARRIVAEQKREGYDFVKVYQMLSPEVYREIVRVAREIGIPVTGHVPTAVGVEGVLASGQVGVDHASQLVEGNLADVARRVRAADIGVTTTLVMLSRSLEMRGRPEVVESLLSLPEAKYLSPETKAFWRRAPYFGMPKADPWMSFYSGTESLVRELVEAGVAVMAGTDAGIWGNEPGWSALEEIERLSEAGLGTYQALRAATVVPGQFLNHWVRGAGQPEGVRVGDRADLLLLEANPLEGLGALRKRVGVMARGKWLSQEELDRMMAELAAGYQADSAKAASR